MKGRLIAQAAAACWRARHHTNTVAHVYRCTTPGGGGGDQDGPAREADSDAGEPDMIQIAN
eukprot:8665220-Pyramimonas_sp.AAC.2